LVGHAAGAHLVARMLAQDWAAAGLPTDTITGPSPSVASTSPRSCCALPSMRRLA
jgi:hypothetical protein